MAGPEVRALLVIEDLALAKTVDLTLRHGTYVRRSAGTVSEARAAIGTGDGTEK